MALREWDFIFDKYRGSIPIEYLRAVSLKEADLNPNARNPKSTATGLFQLMEATVEDYNRLHGQKYVLHDVLDPDLNSKIGIELIRRIAESISRHHPSTFPEQNWLDTNFVAMVTTGFTSGWAEKPHHGVGNLISQLEAKHLPVSLESVFQLAEQEKFPEWWNEAGRKHVQDIVQTYLAQLGKRSVPPTLVALAPFIAIAGTCFFR